jgi:hypothetical protein
VLLLLTKCDRRDFVPVHQCVCCVIVVMLSHALWCDPLRHSRNRSSRNRMTGHVHNDAEIIRQRAASLIVSPQRSINNDERSPWDHGFHVAGSSSVG